MDTCAAIFARFVCVQLPLSTALQLFFLLSAFFCQPTSDEFFSNSPFNDSTSIH